MAVDYANAIIEWGSGTITILELTKQKLGITDNSQDDELSMYIDMAGQACEAYIDNKIVEQVVTEQYAYVKSPQALRFWPANTLSAVIIDGEDVTEDWEMFSSDGVVWNVRDKCNTDIMDCFKQMSVTYTAGYNPVPSDVGYAIVATSLNYESNSGGTGAIKKEVVQGVGSVEYVTDSDSMGSVGLISGTSLGVLERYRRWHV